ncbi:hypothetical protein AAVH_19260 [Aphelenchoides avenae]|nr:hypothetical protein AAVH_19260 [Aphelenchus avenae]
MADERHHQEEQEKSRTSRRYTDSIRVGGQSVTLEWFARFRNCSDCSASVNYRHFQFVNTQSREYLSAVIRGHMRNTFVKLIRHSMTTDPEWDIGTLLNLGDNVTVKTLFVDFVREECLAFFERFEEALVRRRVQKLFLTMPDPLLNAFVTRHNFFVTPAIQQLKKLTLYIRYPIAPLEPYWLPALTELNECRKLTIHYQPEQQPQAVFLPAVRGARYAVDVTRISSALRVMLEDFESGGRGIAIDHFSLTVASGSASIPSLVGNRRPYAEGISASYRATFSTRWDVYYYEAVDKQRCLTLIVPPEDAGVGGRTDVLLKRGKFTDFP